MYTYFLLFGIIFIGIQIKISKVPNKKGLIMPCVLFAIGILFTLVNYFTNPYKQFHTPYQNNITFFANLFIDSLPAIILFLVYLICKMKKLVFKILIIAVIVLITPIVGFLKDGGSVEYRAITYSITFLHRIDENAPYGYNTKTYYDILPFLNN